MPLDLGKYLFDERANFMGRLWRTRVAALMYDDMAESLMEGFRGYLDRSSETRHNGVSNAIFNIRRKNDTVCL